MGSSIALRLRRSAAQLHALAQVEREIRATDTKGRSRYLRDFTEAFRSYTRVLPLPDVHRAIAQSDIVLIGDYHALSASQRFVSQVLKQQTSRPIVVGLEAVFARHQGVLDE